MFRTRLEEQETRRKCARQARIHQFVCKRQLNFSKTVSMLRHVNIALQRLLVGSETEKTNIVRHIARITSPCCETKLDLKNMVSVVCVVTSMVQQHKWITMNVDVRISLLLTLANLAMDKMSRKMMLTPFNVVLCIANQTMNMSLCENEATNLAILINNVYAQHAENEKCLLLTCLQYLAKHSAFAQDVCLRLVATQQRNTLTTLVQTDPLTQSLATCDSQETCAAAMQLLTNTLQSKNFSQKDVRNAIRTYVFSTPHNTRIQTCFFQALSHKHNLFLQSSFLQRLVIDAISLSFSLAETIADLLSEWALVRTKDIFDHLAHNQTMMEALEQNMLGIKHTHQTRIWDKLFYFWINTFPLFHDTPCPFFYAQAMYVYHQMPIYKADTEKVFFYTLKNLLLFEIGALRIDSQKPGAGAMVSGTKSSHPKTIPKNIVKFFSSFR